MTTGRVRKEPPPFRRASVVATESVSPWMTRVVVSGKQLEGFSIESPASSVRLLLPTETDLEIPTWAGNEFLLADGSRPTIRTLTPRRFDSDRLELALDIVHHNGGVLTPWAQAARAGKAPDVAISGPGRGQTIDADASGFVLIGDETAIPAICQLLESLPRVPIQTFVAIRHEDGRVDLHRSADERWPVVESSRDLGDIAVRHLASTNLTEGTHIWAAGEAASMQKIRKHLFTDREFPRNHTTIRGYWK
ncbi:MAG: siderophore-interacting protein [Acidimicrobiia bacterium]